MMAPGAGGSQCSPRGSPVAVDSLCRAERLRLRKSSHQWKHFCKSAINPVTVFKVQAKWDQPEKIAVILGETNLRQKSLQHMHV